MLLVLEGMSPCTSFVHPSEPRYLRAKFLADEASGAPLSEGEKRNLQEEPTGVLALWLSLTPRGCLGLCKLRLSLV